eukprot:TRINITY_DN7271_c0_g1_i1.p1 TRINITY_DN7271_c0_g1~~TRINITY_DN7271_c0_g1_i1.p1  ORF type:complete len:187 (+),score=24.45 TRINITY_DN7271_c0_g1_i1:22-561(+)
MDSVKKLEKVEGCLVVTPKRYSDHRGYFQEHYNQEVHSFLPGKCAQVSYSQSGENVLRGIHCAPYGKLVQCVSGKILDVIVDLRPDSPTFKNWVSVVLDSREAPAQVYVPANCGHAFYSFEPNSFVVYVQEGVYRDGVDKNLNYKDPEIGVEWPVPTGDGGYVISDKDAAAPMLKDIEF